MNQSLQDIGLYVNFEGGDGSGKTTQFNKLSSSLGATKLSSHINKEIKSIRGYIEELSKDNFDLRLSYYLMASIHDSEKAKHLLGEGKNVVSDRNIFSTLAYHRALGSRFAKSIDLDKLNIILPHLTIYLDLNDEERCFRLRNRGDMSVMDKHLEDDRLLLQRVLNEYSKFSDYMVTIDTTSKSIDEVFLEVIAQVKLKALMLI